MASVNLQVVCDRDGRPALFMAPHRADDLVWLAERLRDESASEAEVLVLLDAYRRMRRGGGCQS